MIHSSWLSVSASAEDKTRTASNAWAHALSWDSEPHPGFRTIRPSQRPLVCVKSSMYASSVKMLVRSRRLVVDFRDVDLDVGLRYVIELEPRRKEDNPTPIWQNPSVCREEVVDDVVQDRAPSCAKILSRLDTSAGVRIFHCCLRSFCAGCGFSSSSRAEPESNSAEKTIFARCLFRLVICTARTAA